MNRPAPFRGERSLLVALLLAGLLLAAPAGAQTITVTSAVPEMADQGTLGLVVAVSGGGFDKGSKVAFFVTGTTNPGGITVKSVKYKNPKALEATIDVAPDAQTTLKFDIQVTSGSRTGKGTELFKVNVKVTGGDLTPPGTITDLQAVEVGYNTALLTWTAPADDGDDAATGPVAKYDLRVRRATPECGAFTDQVWIDDTYAGIWADPCHAYRATPAGSAPNSAESITAKYLAPGAQYWAAVRAVDDSPQGPNWSALPEPSQQLLFSTGPAPETDWSAAVVDACPSTSTDSMKPPRLAFGPDGNPTMLYVKGSVPTLATWTGGTWPASGGWLYETAPVIDSGNYAFDLAFDPVTGAPAIASYVPSLSALRFYRRVAGAWLAETVDSGFVRSVELGFALPPGATTAVPTIAYRWEKKSAYVKVAQKVGSSWVRDTVASGVSGGSVYHVHLAFDGVADPAVAFIQDFDGGRRLVLASRKGATWTVGPLPDEPAVFQPNTLQFAELAFNPARGDFSVVGQHLGPNGLVSQVRYCEGNVGVWSCLPDPLFQWDGLWQAGLSVGVREDGAIAVGTINGNTLSVLIRDPASLAWATDFVDWNAARNPQDLHFDAGGRPTIGYLSLHDATGAGGSDGNGSVSIAWKPLQ